MIAVDVHQHLWPDDLLRVLEARATPPRARWRAGVWDVRLPGEPAFTIDPAQHDPARRLDELRAAGVDQALVALSSPVGLETLPGVEVARGWAAAAARLPAGLGWWAAVPLAASAADRVAVVREAIADGAGGACLPAPALGTVAAAEAALPLLSELDAAGSAVFVHPGAAAGAADDPVWWAPATSYVAQLHVAWHAFHHVVRPALPGLRVVFALLAGLAPLHLERTVARGGDLQAAVDDPRCFYDTSSYGPRSVLSMAMAVGTGQLVHGTDFPVAARAEEPVALALGPNAAQLVRRENAARALGRTRVPA